MKECGSMDIPMHVLVKRFKDYISYNTQSDEANDKECPSTPGQLVLAKHIAEELKEIGLSNVELDKHGYVMAELPANGCEDAPTVGFISHLDTAQDAAGGPIRPRIVENYDGKDIVLNKEKNIVLTTKSSPSLLRYKGQDIMVTDGTTLLGADDKAGDTAIISAAEYLIQHPEIQHGRIRLGFTPDEETGRSPNLFDVKQFDADFGFTVDGGEIGGLEYENFNAGNPVITIHGISAHTGSAKGVMKNAISIAAEWQAMLPAGEKPEYTEGREGFFHVMGIEGTCAKVVMHMLVRDFDKEHFEARKAYLEKMADFLNEKYGAGTVEVKQHDMYFNMYEKIQDGNMYIIELAREAMKAAGVEPVTEPIRGGTDGARLSFVGLPCPNIFTGGVNFHSNYEFLPLPSLKAAADTTLQIMVKAGQLKK